MNYFLSTKFKAHFCSLITVFLLFSCTTIHYESSGKIPVYIGAKKGHTYFSTIDGEIDFFLWGLYPNSHTVRIDREIQKKGIKSASNVSIREYQSFLNLFYSIISLGLVYPVNYEITSYGILPSENEFVEIPNY